MLLLRTDQLGLRYHHLSDVPSEQTLFQSAWSVKALLTQKRSSCTIRTPKVPFLQRRACAPLLVATGVIIAVGIFLPMGRLPAISSCRRCPLPGAYFPILVVIVVGYMTLTQLVNGFYERRFGWQ